MRGTVRPSYGIAATVDNGRGGSGANLLVFFLTCTQTKTYRKRPRSSRISPALGLSGSRGKHFAEPLVIKLDLINEVVTKTGVTKTKAEMAVETVFESMKKALAKGD